MVLSLAWYRVGRKGAPTLARGKYQMEAFGSMRSSDCAPAVARHRTLRYEYELYPRFRASHASWSSAETFHGRKTPPHAASTSMTGVGCVDPHACVRRHLPHPQPVQHVEHKSLECVGASATMIRDPV